MSSSGAISALGKQPLQPTESTRPAGLWCGGEDRLGQQGADLSKVPEARAGWGLGGGAGVGVGALIHRLIHRAAGGSQGQQ